MPTDDLDEKLAERFAALQAEDEAHAPALPSLQAPQSSADARPLIFGRYAAIAATAFLAVTVGVVTVWLSRPGKDPVAAYASLAPAWPSETDHLLNVSASVLPGTNQWPPIFENREDLSTGQIPTETFQQ